MPLQRGKQHYTRDHPKLPLIYDMLEGPGMEFAMDSRVAGGVLKARDWCYGTAEQLGLAARLYGLPDTITEPVRGYVSEVRNQELYDRRRNEFEFLERELFPDEFESRVSDRRMRAFLLRHKNDKIRTPLSMKADVWGQVVPETIYRAQIVDKSKEEVLFVCAHNHKTQAEASDCADRLMFELEG